LFESHDELKISCNTSLSIFNIVTVEVKLLAYQFFTGAFGGSFKNLLIPVPNMSIISQKPASSAIKA